LAIGGARSGTSRSALGLAEATAPERLYLAAAEAGAAEMAGRTREEPLELAAALRAEARPGRVVLVDCLTLWLANLTRAGRDVEAQISELTKVLSDLGGPAVLIANEVGAGVVPAIPLGRAFSRLAGAARPGGRRLRRGRRRGGRPADPAQAGAAARHPVALIRQNA
jgi:adenosylcobinamide kinase/adenosylcobinamide-phosphate guanylyltransferase